MRQVNYNKTILSNANDSHLFSQITSLKWSSTVERRYNDFLNFYNYLIVKFSNRIIPRMPPKQLMLDTLLEERRIGLQRWLKLLSNHRILSADKLFKMFLTDTANVHQENLRQAFEESSDEFLAIDKTKFTEILDHHQLTTNRELIRIMLNSVLKLKRLIEKHLKRKEDQTNDFGEMSTVLSVIIKESNDKSLIDFSECFRKISVNSDKTEIESSHAVIERLTMLIEVLIGHSDLCDRVDKIISCNDHLELSQILSHGKQKVKDVINGMTSDNEKLISERQTTEIEMLKKRKSFALFCIAEETKFAQKYLELLPSILLQFSHTTSRESSKITEIWNEIVSIESEKLN